MLHQNAPNYSGCAEIFVFMAMNLARTLATDLDRQIMDGSPPRAMTSKTLFMAMTSSCRNVVAAIGLLATRALQADPPPLLYLPDDPLTGVIPSTEPHAPDGDESEG